MTPIQQESLEDMTPPRPRVLIIDDTPANLQTLGRALAGEYELHIATSGADGLRLAEETRPDVILLDIMMPQMDGYETLKNLRTLLGKDMPAVIFMTADDREETQVKGLELGADDFVAKPIVLPVLMTRVRNAVWRKQDKDKLRLAANVFSYAREGILITDREINVIDVNQAFTQMNGYYREEMLGRNPRVLKSGRQDKDFYAVMWQSLLTNGHWFGEVWNRHKDGRLMAQHLTISTVRNEHGEIQNYIGLFADITALKDHEAQLEQLAHYDPLTGLANRLLLGDRLRQAMSQVPRRDRLLAVAYLDLDGFKAVNDIHGHAAGDHLLATLARRMTQTLRDGDTLARLGGDEFCVVLIDLPDSGASLPLLTRLLETAAQPVAIDDAVLQVSATLGVTFYPQSEAIDADQLLRQADQAMYQAKLAGKNRYHIFDAEQDRSVRGYHENLEQIRLALSSREFVLYYQPKVNMHTGEILGAEALIRWNHPKRGLLSPAVFLPVIEAHPLAVELGEWVIDTALTQIEIWRAEGLGIPVSVNVGALQLQHPGFIARLSEQLTHHSGVKPDDLEIEILETSALEDMSGVSQVIEVCRKLNVGFALDDFGTGYSSLAYLKQLPANVLKIDQSFVRDMLDDPDDLSILQGILALATAFGRQVIAEGVETPAHAEMLLRMGCPWGQGYAIARPMPAQNFTRWANTWEVPLAWKSIRPVSQDTLPVLFAAVVHRAWVNSMIGYLAEERDAPPDLDVHRCRFGIWLDQTGRDLIFDGRTDHPLDALHRDIHRLAAELNELKQSGHAECAQARIPELQCLRDQMLEQLAKISS